MERKENVGPPVHTGGFDFKIFSLSFHQHG